MDLPGETQAAAQSIADNGGVYLVPAFVGLSAPYWQPNARAAIVGLTPSSTREHIIRAALESIGYQVRDAIDLMSTAGGVKLQQIYGDGGMVANTFLMQFVADVCGLTVEASEVPELSALGAAQAGLLGMSFFADITALTAIRLPTVRYVPQAAATLVENWYQGWLVARTACLVTI